MNHFNFTALASVILLATACGTPSSRGDSATKSIEVTEKPTKIYYVEGEDFDPEGMKITANYENGFSEILADDAYTIRNGTNLEASKAKTNIVIEYEKKTTTTPIKVLTKGNALEYSVEQTATMENSPLKGNNYLFLGSSVTLGMEAENESMADFLAKVYDCNVVKLAKSGTKIGLDDATHGESYLTRFNSYLAGKDVASSLDGFIVQLSTNDAQLSAEEKGDITAADKTSLSDFDTSTTYGALEAIIVTAKEKWNCPIYVYCNAYFESEEYKAMVEKVDEFVEKWNIGYIDLYRDVEFNDLTVHTRALYMHDDIHPTRAGYRDWWLDKFYEGLGGE